MLGVGLPFSVAPCPPFKFSLAHLQLSIVFQHFLKKLQRVLLFYIQTRPTRLSTALSTLHEAPALTYLFTIAQPASFSPPNLSSFFFAYILHSTRQNVKMSSNVFLTLGERTVMIARPATYQDLLSEIRGHFPRVSSVYSLVVLFQPANINGGLLNNWVEVDASAYSAVHDGAELFVNVVHPLTKEYILPLPDRPVPNRQHRKQVRRTDGFGNRVGVEDGDLDATAQQDQVSKFRPRGVSSRPRGASHKFDNSLLSLELEQPGGDAFGSGWAAASERFRRSTKLVPNLKDCKEAIGKSVGESNFYPEDEEEQTADFKLGLQQNQRPQATEAGWYAGAEPTRGAETPGETSAQHLAGGVEEAENEGKRNTLFYSNNANRNWFAAPHSPPSFQEALPRSIRGTPLPASPQWGCQDRNGNRWGACRTPSPTRWVPYHGEGHNIPGYLRSLSCSPNAGAGNLGGNPGGWNSTHNEMNVADQGYSRTVAGQGGHTEAGHLTNGVLTNGVTTNGNLTNGHAAAHSEVSHNPQHQLQHHGASEWSPQRPQSNGFHRPQYPQTQGYHPYGQPNFKAFAGPRPRRDPAEITYGSPRPRIPEVGTGWTPIGHKKKTWTNKPVQEESEPEGAQGPSANNNQAWYGTPPPNYLNRTTGHGGASKHRGFVRHGTNNYTQKASGPAMSWGSDFWGGPPPERTQRGAIAQDTPASKHWQ